VTLDQFLLDRVVETQAIAEAAAWTEDYRRRDNPGPDESGWNVVKVRRPRWAVGGDGYLFTVPEDGDEFIPPPAPGVESYDGSEILRDEVIAFMADNDPARVLAECEAKRRIVRAAREAIRFSDETPDDGSPRSERIHGAATAYEYVLEYMVRTYADHPAYQQEWKP
jgi:hypothetical protein